MKRSLHALLHILNCIEEWTLVAILLGLAFLTTLQVLCRYAFHFSFSWTEELGRCLGVFVTFLGASLGVKYGTHFSMDFLYERLSSDRVRSGLQAVVNVLCAVLFFMVAWFGWQQSMKLRRFGVHTSALELPKYWAYLPIPLFSAIMGARFLHLAARYFLMLVRSEPFRMIRNEQP